MVETSLASEKKIFFGGQCNWFHMSVDNPFKDLVHKADIFGDSS